MVVHIRLGQLLVILSITKFFSFFRESIRNCLLSNNCKKIFSFGKLHHFQTGASFFFFILRLGLESLLGRVNQQSFRTMIAIRTKLAVMPHYQSCAVRNYLKKYPKFFIFTLGVRKCTMVFFHQESIRDFFKGVKSCDSRSNQASFQNIKNF